MKCILINGATKGDAALRVPNDIARVAVEGGEFHYVPKSVWKRTGRHTEADFKALGFRPLGVRHAH